MKGWTRCVIVLMALLLPAAAWAELPEVTYVELEEGVNYTREDGVLTIHEGVVAFKDTWDTLYEITEIRFPSTLRYIGDDAIIDAYNLQELAIPEGVLATGLSLGNCRSLRRISLPASLRSFGGIRESEGHDSACPALEAFEVAPGSAFFTTVDGVLFTADMRTLVCYPTGRRSTHYDVPAGVETIGEFAFAANRYLESVSLPAGVRAIETYAFADMYSLCAIALPLTLERIGAGAFARSVMLGDVAVPAHTVVAEDEHEVTDVLSDWIWVDEETGLPEPVAVIAVADPDDARGTVPLYLGPDDRSVVIENAPSGTCLMLTGQEGAYYQIEYHEKFELMTAYVRKEDVALLSSLQGLFVPEGIRAHGKDITVYRERNELLPFLPERKEQISCDHLIMMSDPYWYGQWLHVSYPRWEEWESGSFWNMAWELVYLADVELTRPYTGDSRTLGMVVNADPRDRTDLRETPEQDSQSLGRFYTGTQVVVLGEAGVFYHVRVCLDEGYMMRSAIRIVEQEGPKP